MKPLARPNAPKARHPDRLAEPPAVPGADGAPRQCLGRVGEAIQGPRRQMVKLKQDGVGGQHHVAHLGPDGNKNHVRRDQEDSAQKDVAVDGQHAPDSGAVEDQVALPAPSDARQVAAHQPQAEKRGGDLGDQAGRRDPGDAVTKADNEYQIQDDIEAVHDQLLGKDGAGVMDTDEPAHHGGIGERRRRPPDAHRDIGIGQGENGVARRDDGKRRPGHRPADCHHDDSQGHRHQHRADKGGPHLHRRYPTPEPGRRAPWFPCAGSQDRNRER